MDRSVLRLPDPIATPTPERRRSVRQKLHTPVYASFNGPQTGMVVDLSELLDLHEDGFAVQTSEPLEMNRAVTLSLDLTETKAYIHGSGQVIWSDSAGRGGIRFSALPESSRRVLKEWLFANLLIACSNHAARTEQLARREEEKSSESAPIARVANVVSMPGRSGTLSSVEAVRREVREMGDDVEAVLRLITERALNLTGATGAALAFLTGEKIICRARTGEPAPPLGAPVDITHGLSGECARTGLLVSCEDLENDPRLDPEVGRGLGIGSLMAAPIVSDFRVVGLLEVFSPNPRSFTKDHETVLERLVEMIPKANCEKTQPENIIPEGTRTEIPSKPEPVSEVSPQPPALELRPIESAPVESVSIHAPREALWEAEPEAEAPVETPLQVTGEIVPERAPEPAPTVPPRLFHFGLLVLCLLVVFVVLGYLVGSRIERRLTDSPPASDPKFVKASERAPTVSGRSASDQRSADQRTPAKSLSDLQKRAEQGDAEAQWQMGVRYHDGEGVPQSDAQAMQWFQRAAEQGHVDAQSHLGAYYWAGRGVPKDLSQSYFWSRIAMAQGDEISKARVEGLSSQMTRAQVSAARQQAEVWLRTHSQRAKSEAN